MSLEMVLYSGQFASNGCLGLDSSPFAQLLSQLQRISASIRMYVVVDQGLEARPWRLTAISHSSRACLPSEYYFSYYTP